MRPVESFHDQESSGGEQYDEDEFIDGEESTSKEVKRLAFEIESLTEKDYSQLQLGRGSISIGDSSSMPGESAGIPKRPAVIKQGKPNGR